MVKEGLLQLTIGPQGLERGRNGIARETAVHSLVDDWPGESGIARSPRVILGSTIPLSPLSPMLQQ